ncbi:MAG: hypothetical protein WAZ98_04515 [Cyclobacteriaceae bacterium]
MATATKKVQRKRTAKKSVAISKKVKSYDKAPFFVKKAKAMEAILKAHGLPSELAHA